MITRTLFKYTDGASTLTYFSDLLLFDQRGSSGLWNPYRPASPRRSFSAVASKFPFRMDVRSRNDESSVAVCPCMTRHFRDPARLSDFVASPAHARSWGSYWPSIGGQIGRRELVWPIRLCGITLLFDQLMANHRFLNGNLKSSNIISQLIVYEFVSYSLSSCEFIGIGDIYWNCRIPVFAQIKTYTWKREIVYWKFHGMWTRKISTPTATSIGRTHRFVPL